MFSSVYIALRVKPSFCIVACFSSAIYTSYVQTWNKPLGSPMELQEGLYKMHRLLMGCLSFQFEDQNKNIVQLSYRIKSVLEKKNATIIRRDIMCIRG